MTIVAVAIPHNNEPLEERDCANCNVAQENDELQQRVWELEAKLLLPHAAALDAANQRIAELEAAGRRILDTMRDVDVSVDYCVSALDTFAEDELRRVLHLPPLYAGEGEEDEEAKPDA